MELKMEMDVPPQVREFAKKSVDQAERAVLSFMEFATKSIAMVPTPMSDVAKHALAIAEANVKASFEHARKLMEAKDITEVMQLQTEFLRNQFGVATDQFKQMTGDAVFCRQGYYKNLDLIKPGLLLILRPKKTPPDGDQRAGLRLEI